MSDKLSLIVKNAIEESLDLFKRNLKTLAKLEDILLAITGMGKSESIVQVLKAAKEIGIKTLSFLGSDGGESLKYYDLSFCVPSNKTARVQEVHITAGHALIEYVEDKLIQEEFLKLG